MTASQLGLEGLHKDLIFIVGGFEINAADQIDQFSRFSNIAAQRLFTDHAFEFGPLFDGINDLLHDGYAGKVGSKDRHRPD